MFASTKRDGDLPAPLRSGSQEPGLSILAPGIRIVGEIETQGVVKIEGQIEGSVRADGQVLVARGGVVKGDIATRQAVIAGEVHGGIFADERVELQASCVIDGDITAPRIVVEEGGQVNGQIRMANPQAVTQQQKSGKGQSEKSERSGMSTPVFEMTRGSGPSSDTGGLAHGAPTGTGRPN